MLSFYSRPSYWLCSTSMPARSALRREYNRPDRNDGRRYCSSRDGRSPRLAKNYSVADWFRMDGLPFCGTVGGARVLLLWSWTIDCLGGPYCRVRDRNPDFGIGCRVLVLSEPITLKLVSGAVLIGAGIYPVSQWIRGASFRSAPRARTIHTRFCCRR